MNTEVELEIKNQLLKNNCQLKIFTKKSENITYICACGLEKKQMYADYIRRKCRTCTEKRIRDDDFKEGYENDIIEESCEINNTNHIIEVKSNYTFYKEHQKNSFKFKSVINNRSC